MPRTIRFRAWTLPLGACALINAATIAQDPPVPPDAPAAPAEPAEPPDDEAPDTPAFPWPTAPLGYAGDGTLPALPRVPNVIRRDTIAVPDRWRIGWPRWDRYGRTATDDPLFMNNAGGDAPYTLGHPFNPYDRNVLKGDYPVIDDDIFINATFLSDTLLEMRRLPTPSGVSATDPGAFDFFGDGKQEFISQSVFASIDVFRGNTSFRPVDWLFRVTGAYNYNRLELRENSGVNVDVRDGARRSDDFATLQEAFFEYHLGDVSPFFDVAALRVGRQLFVSDFRGFIFSDVSDGVRLLGNYASNRIQYNLAVFNQNEKDTNSGLNELHWRDQQIAVANVVIQDTFVPGYNTQLSFHWNHDQSDREHDSNGFPVIPDLAGSATLRDVDAYYLGWTSDGHVGRLNVNHALYYAWGEDTANPIAGRAVDIGAFLAALELSVDIDWLRPKISGLYASGDDDPLDDTARGFDAILDNPFFAGGSGSFIQGQAFRLFGVDLIGPRSLLFDLAAPKAEGVSNFVNPGTQLVNLGLDAELTPKLRASVNYNRVWFAETGTLELFLNQNDIDRHFGDEFNLVVQYRPWLNNNLIITGGGSVFMPGTGFEDVYDDTQNLYRVFAGLTITY